MKYQVYAKYPTSDHWAWTGAEADDYQRALELAESLVIGDRTRVAILDTVEHEPTSVAVVRDHAVIVR